MAGFIVTTGDCDDCSRGRVPRIAERLPMVNQLLSEAGLGTLRMIELSVTEWERVRAAAAQTQLHRPISRRGLFRGFIDTAETVIEMDEAQLEEEESALAPGRWLPEKMDATAVHWPYTPYIETERCSGCDACARICPHQAIRLARDPQGLCYILNPRNCTGCNLCQDVCETEAVHVEAWRSAAMERLGLDERECSVCGAPFHIPANIVDEQERPICRICQQINHHRNLFQVLD
ncbi:MAG TPA: 4Fe-4S dicluster domain-containing protein [Chromatiales bacterium]|nr:4Fe-4S dicluster domain-containing protein [Chromatiales bacterium]